MELFNASEYLLDRRVVAGDGGRTALVCGERRLTYAELHAAVERAAGGLAALGLLPEQRLLMVVVDCPEFVVLYLAAMRIGAVPVPVSTMLRAPDIADLLDDSRAPLVAVSAALAPTVAEALQQASFVRTVIDIDGAGLDGGGATVVGMPDADPVAVYPTTADSPAFWLYTSGTTGKPKGAMHRHGAISSTCETYGAQVLGIRPDDVCLSAAKAFFAYGLGNSVLFPLAVGAASVLLPSPSRPDVIASLAAAEQPTLFFAGPTFFANMLRAELPADALASVRLCASAGEPLPASLYERFTRHFGVDILDGIGMTEMLHIFLSNREGQVRPGTTGVAVPGYDLQLRDESGGVIEGSGVPGTLFVRGASTATGYWSRYDASRQVFQGEWLRTGDTYVRDDDGYYACLGRTGDMLKASGIWVSPADIEARLLAHPDVTQAVVVAATDGDGLEKPVAYVILASGSSVGEDELLTFCRDGLPSFKRPRRILVVDEYPTTATGKVRRVELRALADTALVTAAAVAAGTPAAEVGGATVPV
ncbi:benzoate-CoA ligase family protein [Jatrophihabitans sp. YIM 134969]